MIVAFCIAESVIQITGDDSKSYLHGQVTQDLNSLNDDNFLFSGHCNAKGKLWSVQKLIKHNNEYHVICGNQEREQSFAEIKKYGVFSKVDFEILDTYTLLGLITPNQDELSSLGIDFPNNSNRCNTDFGYALKLPNNLVQLVVNNGSLATLENKLKLEQNESAWRAELIKAGIARLSIETLDEFVPQMVNLQALNGISFNKGCYTGQETVARMKYLGKNKRAMFALQGEGFSVNDAHELEVQLGENWRRAGKILQTATTDEQSFVQAVLPNDIEFDAVLRIKDQAETKLTLLPLPYSLED